MDPQAVFTWPQHINIPNEQPAPGSINARSCINSVPQNTPRGILMILVMLCFKKSLEETLKADTFIPVIVEHRDLTRCVENYAEVL